MAVAVGHEYLRLQWQSLYKQDEIRCESFMPCDNGGSGVLLQQKLSLAALQQQAHVLHDLLAMKFPRFLRYT
jgi:hypothetical protein